MRISIRREDKSDLGRVLLATDEGGRSRSKENKLSVSSENPPGIRAHTYALASRSFGESRRSPDPS